MDLTTAVALLDTSGVVHVSLEFTSPGDGTVVYSPVSYYTADGSNEFTDKDKALVEAALENCVTNLIFEFPVNILRDDGGRGHINIDIHEHRYSLRIEQCRKVYDYYAYNGCDLPNC